MKPQTYLSIEVYGLLIGLVGAQLIGLALLFMPSLSSSSDQPGAVAMSMLIVIGIIGSLFFVINVVNNRAMAWHYRLTGFLIFYLALAIISVLAR